MGDAPGSALTPGLFTKNQGALPACLSMTWGRHAGSALCVSPACVDTSRGPGQRLTFEKHLLSLAEAPRLCVPHFKRYEH